MRVLYVCAIDELPVMREILMFSDIVSPAHPRVLKLTHIKMDHPSEHYKILLTQSRVLFSCLPPHYPISFWSFCHFVLHSDPSLFLFIPMCLFLTSPHSAAPGSVSPFLGRFFSSHILRKWSLFLLSSVDSPLTVMKQHRGISFEEEGLKTPFSSLYLIYWGIKEKMREQRLP